MTEQQQYRPGLEETIESFSGFDEIAVAKSFGTELEELSTFRTLRAATFVLKRREGLSDKDAYAEAMGMSMKAVQGQFPDFDPEADDRDPMVEQTPAGKDDEQLS